LQASFPPTILAIDTAADRCTIALARAGRVESSAGPAGAPHLEQVIPMIDALLARCAVRLEDCDALAFGSGPGSFTGLRIACGVAQGLAYGCARPLIAVGNLRALAYGAAAAEAGARMLAAVDARMRQVYWAAFDAADGQWQEAAPAAVADAADLAALVERWRPSVIAGNALGAYAADWPPAMPARRCGAARADAAAIAALACIDLAAGRVVAPQAAAPVYVRDRVALTIAERRAALAGAGR
jgi:tRNA threonylcarbamoyladenosine biosynthesis protein TsaB